MTGSICLKGGRVMTSNGAFEIGDVHIANERIVETGAADSRHIDCRGYAVLPGIVDVHGDAFEDAIHPRPGVDIDLPIALRSVDRQLVANGITSAFHGLSISWEPGARSLSAARRFVTGLESLRPSLIADHRVQLRWETFAHDAIDDVARWLASKPAPAIAFNDHTTQTLAAISSGTSEKLEKWARRAGVTLERYLAEAEAVSARRPQLQEKISEVAALASEYGAVMLAHDECTVEDRLTNRGLGMNVSEFPITPEVAAQAAAKGEHVVMGAPNVIRGGSHKGSMSAEDAIRSGLCTVLASDYYYPSLFHACERLVRRGVLSVSDAWHLVSRNPASAMGLRDRGEIRPGNRADIVIADCTDDWRIVHAIAGGSIASFGV